MAAERRKLEYKSFILFQIGMTRLGWQWSIEWLFFYEWMQCRNNKNDYYYFMSESVAITAVTVTVDKDMTGALKPREKSGNVWRSSTPFSCFLFYKNHEDSGLRSPKWTRKRTQKPIDHRDYQDSYFKTQEGSYFSLSTMRALKRSQKAIRVV
jgi:hypothetical protein